MSLESIYCKNKSDLTCISTLLIKSLSYFIEYYICIDMSQQPLCRLELNSLCRHTQAFYSIGKLVNGNVISE